MVQTTGLAMLDKYYHTLRTAAALWLTGWLIGIVPTACQPRITVEAPKDPIVINLNVKIEHEVRVKVDRELENVFEQNPELFGQ
ncbi:MAG: YnbE family lipoprotein [Nitrospira sp.]